MFLRDYKSYGSSDISITFPFGNAGECGDRTDVSQSLPAARECRACQLPEG
jgi:hypothetical protein